MHRKPILKKCISFLLAALMFVQCGYFVMPKAYAASSASEAGSVILGDVTLKYSQRLVENSNGSYTLTLVFDAQAEHRDGNQNAAIARNGYYTAPADGDYLIQLWGGDGGSSNGTGGAGGYVYGIVSLKKGETLFYTLGGNGYRTDRAGVGGGVNGPGGSAGELAVTTVGGGGGYSAVFLYGAGEFESGYFTDNGEYGGNSVTDSDRTSRFIMIAGGGGGGGGNASDGRYSPDGGAGGHMGSTAVSDDRAGISGTVFAGSNGLSSSTNDNYVGEGGAVNPGSYSDSWTTLLKSAQGNNWLGNAVGNMPAGAGGSGNMHGGAGGAGYTGGGGGIMSTIFTNTAVGGGGGGSSFLADSVDYQSVDAGLLSGTDESQSGGYIVIQALGVDTSYLQSVNVDIPESEYFNRTVSGATVGANLDGGDPLSLTLHFEPKAGFAGGNAVPLLENERITVTAGGHTASVYLQPACSAVNVPLNFRVAIKPSQTYDLSADNPVEPVVGLMYEDNYADVRGNLAGDWRYHFIESIGEYIVTDPNGTVLDAEDTVAPEATTAYPVSFTVTPKSGAPAVVGTPVTTRVYTGYAKVFVTVGEEFVMGEVTLSSNKSIVANGDGTFTLSLNVAGGGEATTYYAGKKVEIPEMEDLTTPNLTIGASATKDGVLSKTSDTYPVEKAGWYLIQVWGGNGGDGEPVTYHEAGEGGTGGYVYGYRHFAVGDTIELTAGINGADGSGGGALNRKPGGGGKYSAVNLDLGENAKDYLIIGGGGGGGTSSSWSSGRDGDSATGAPGSNLNSSMAAYDGVSGGDGGDAGANFRNSSVYVDPNADTGTTYPALNNESKTAITNAASASNPNTDTNGTVTNGGAAKITCLQLDPEEEYTYSDTEGGTQFSAEQYMARLIAELQNYSLTVGISKYFDVVENGVTLVQGENSTVLAHTTNGQTISISGINPAVNCEDLETTVGKHDFIADINFTIKITLTPKDGFLGGNDVPLLAYGEPGSAETSTNMVLGQIVGETEHEEDIPRITECDFVNVAIPNNAVTGTIDASDELIEVVNGQTVQRDELYTVIGHGAPADAWKADFVSFNTALIYQDTGNTVPDGPLAPTETTYYEVVLSVEPKAEPIKAENTPATSVSVAKDRDDAGDLVVIYVLPVVEYHLTNLNNVNEYDSNYRYPVKPYGSNFEDTLSTYTAPNGKVYLPPESITVTRTSGGTVTTLEEGSDYEYNQTTGKITIAKSVLGYDLITIYAEGVLKEMLTITYYYQQSPDDTTGVQVQGPEFDSGDSLTVDNAKIPVHTEYEGYSFEWQWLGYGSMPSIISENLVAIGRYSPNSYTLTVKYLDDKGAELRPQTTQTVFYGDSYTVTAPAIDGYAPDKASETDVMPAGNKTVVFTYHKTDGQLTIHYVYADGSQAAAPYSATIKTGQSYTIPSPTITGYTADLSAVVISSVTPEQVKNGIMQVVTYHPNLYTVSFDTNGGTCDTTPYTVEYGNVYGYDPINMTAKPLPTPIQAGYTFDGWYLGEDKIESSTVVTITENSTLTAQWTMITTYVLSVKYVYEDGTQAAETISTQLEEGTEYSVDSPIIDGYTADILTVSGTMGTQNVLFTVTYIKDARTLTVYYCYANGDPIELSRLGGLTSNPERLELIPGEYTINAIEVAGYNTPAAKTVVIEKGVDQTITFYYTPGIPVVDVTITWGTLSFVYDGGVWHADTHTYDPEPSFEPEKTGYNIVTVTNNAASTVPVDVSVSYASNPGYEYVDGYFTSASYATGSVIKKWTLTVGDSKKVYFWLTGMLSASQAGTYECGVCTVTITSAGGE